jgi:cytochrome c-type biogenesis protein CcmH
MKWFFLAMILLAGPACAVQPDEVLANPQLESRARNLSEGFRCLVCQNQSIDESDATLARDLRILIRERLTAGDNDQQITDFIVARYGDYVLLKPRFTGQTAILWAAPFIILLVGFGYFLKRKNPSSLAEQPLTPEEHARLREL